MRPNILKHFGKLERDIFPFQGIKSYVGRGQFPNELHDNKNCIQYMFWQEMYARAQLK